MFYILLQSFSHRFSYPTDGFSDYPLHNKGIFLLLQTTGGFCHPMQSIGYRSYVSVKVYIRLN